jgi:hypothetical protein
MPPPAAFPWIPPCRLYLKKSDHMRLGLRKANDEKCPDQINPTLSKAYNENAPGNISALLNLL